MKTHSLSRRISAVPLRSVLVVLGIAASQLYADSKEPKHPVAVEYVGHLVSVWPRVLLGAHRCLHIR